MRKFNSTGLCVPSKHYMVDLTSRVEQVRAMVEAGDYFCINRARQYGKTTLLTALSAQLKSDCEVVGLDFQAFSQADFVSEGSFCRTLSLELLEQDEVGEIALTKDAQTKLVALASGSSEAGTLTDLFRALRTWIAQANREVVLIIDEVDSATNNQVFLDFLAKLRLQYINRERNQALPAFKSVILAGVTDVKHLCGKIRSEDKHTVNSPWNIAAPFDVVMSFSAEDVAGMLCAYERDHSTGMNVGDVAQAIVDWTAGYPFLVSRICQLIDEEDLSWNALGVDEAVRKLLKDDNVSLFDSLMGKLANYPALKERLRLMLMRGEMLEYLPYDEPQRQLRMYGFVREHNGRAIIANRIFETLLYNQFLGEEREGGAFRRAGDLGRSAFVSNGRLDMCAVLEGFRRTYVQVFGLLEDGERFAERDGRELFLLYLKPIINGTGNYYIEAQTRDQTRTDVVVDYGGEQYVIELKIWRGRRYNEAVERQIAEYLDFFGLNTGYMLSFCFAKHKDPGIHRVTIGDKVLFEEIV